AFRCQANGRRNCRGLALVLPHFLLFVGCRRLIDQGGGGARLDVLATVAACGGRRDFVDDGQGFSGMQIVCRRWLTFVLLLATPCAWSANATLTIDAAHPSHPVSPRLIGVF